jgi:hypothetical protein
VFDEKMRKERGGREREKKRGRGRERGSDKE